MSRSRPGRGRTISAADFGARSGGTRSESAMGGRRRRYARRRSPNPGAGPAGGRLRRPDSRPGDRPPVFARTPEHPRRRRPRLMSITSHPGEVKRNASPRGERSTGTGSEDDGAAPLLPERRGPPARSRVPTRPPRPKVHRSSARRRRQGSDSKTGDPESPAHVADESAPGRAPPSPSRRATPHPCP